MKGRLGTLTVLIVLGLVLGALCAASGLTSGGMGHGWALPGGYGVLSLVLYPLALARLGWLTARTRWRYDLLLTVPAALLAFGIVADLPDLPAPPQSAIGELLALGGIPFLYLVGGLALYPKSLHAAAGDAALLLLGLVLDALALSSFEPSPDRVADAVLLGPWAALWLGWQLAAAAALWRHVVQAREARAVADSGRRSVA